MATSQLGVDPPNGKSQTTTGESYPSSNKMRRFPIGMEPISLLMLVVSVLSARFLPSYSHALSLLCLGFILRGQFLISRNRLNDDFCDCLDGTDEPDCCDGSDEYGGSIKCPSTCIMGGNVEYKLESHDLHTQTSVVNRKEKENSLKSEDLLLKVKGLKTVITLQAVLVCLLLIHCFYRR